MVLQEVLGSVPLFSHLSQEDLGRLATEATTASLEPGEVLFEEGDEGDVAYVISAGDVEVLKTSGPRQVLLALRGKGDVIGEMALLDAAPRMATVRAKTSVELVAISKGSLDRLLDSSAGASRALFGVLLARWRETEARLRQTERMAQLGTFTAGVAHELNNPAAAIVAGARFLTDAVDRHTSAVGNLRALGLHPDGHELLHRLLEIARQPAPERRALERTDLEDEVKRKLTVLEVGDAARMAPRIVAAGLATDDLEAIFSEFGDQGTAVVEACVTAAEVATVVREIAESSSRMSAIVGALKSYSHLDQAPLARVDIHSGLDNTLLILGYKLAGIDVQLDYAEDVSAVLGDPGELNQVWTNLIDNAIDALAETSDPQITIRTSFADGSAMVEITDNGPGIPDDVRPRIFDAFFTTKPPGSGTGLGLEISYGIVVNRHQGDIEVESRPGVTTFRVTIPLASE